MLRKTLLGLSVAVAAFGVQAEELSKSALSKKFQTITPFKITAVEKAPIDDFYQLVTERGIFYISKNGEHIISGSIHEAKSNLPNLTKQRMAKVHREKLTALKDSFVTFEAVEQQHEMVVFYDASCGFCKRLHGEIDQLTANGVTVHYAGWPRSGVQDRRNPQQFSSGYIDLQNIWCSDNPQKAFDKSVAGAHIESTACETKIAEHFKLGEQMGVRGTPAIYNMDGEQVTRGYAPAQEIINSLERL